MNEVMLVGRLRQGPKLAPTANGFSVLWFSLAVNDRKIGKPEVMEVMCLPRWEPQLQQAAVTRQRWRQEFVVPLETTVALLRSRGARVMELSSADASDAWLPLLGRPRMAAGK